MKHESENHSKYINSKFIIDCNTSVFTDAEIALLKTYGSWLRALMKGKIKPNTDEQKQFFACMRVN